MSSIEFYFSIGSTYTYLSVTRILDVEKKHGVKFNWKPFSVRAIMKEMNNIPFPKDKKNKVDYINSHGTSTPVGDIKELEAIKEVFKENIPKISSTKSLTGHSLGATGVQEAIYCLLMMENKFISASANIENMDERAKNFPIVTKAEKDIELKSVMSNSFGFGGTNATLVFEKLD